MNFAKVYLKYFNLFKYSRVKYLPRLYFLEKNIVKSTSLKRLEILNNYQKYQIHSCLPLIFAGIFFKSKSEQEENPEKYLITMIKRSILCIQKKEYDKAEQMLHLSLKIAQEIKHSDGITFIYDVMANLALEQQQFEKAEKLFVEVMKRLFNNNYKEDNIKILHISSKVAHISLLKGDFEKAEQGLLWAIEKMEEKLKALPDDKEAQELYGIIQNWYGQLLIETGKFAQAKVALLKAYDILTKEFDKVNEDVITILNNLSVVCSNLGENIEARKYLEEALEIANKIPGIVEIGIIQANLGLLYLKDNMIKKATEICSTAYRCGKKNKNEDVIKQAGYCLDQIKIATKK